MSDQTVKQTAANLFLAEASPQCAETRHVYVLISGQIYPIIIHPSARGRQARPSASCRDPLLVLPGRRSQTEEPAAVNKALAYESISVDVYFYNALTAGVSNKRL